MTWMGRGARSLQHQARYSQEVMAKILRRRRGSNQGLRGLPIDKPGPCHQQSLAIIFASCNGMIEYNILHKLNRRYFDVYNYHKVFIAQLYQM